MSKIRHSLGLLVLLFCFLLSLVVVQRQREHRKWERLSQGILNSSFEEDALSRHFTFQSAEEFGIQRGKNPLPLYEKNTYEGQILQTKAWLQLINQIEESKLDKVSKKTLRITRNYLTQKEKLDSYLYFEEPFSPTSGIHLTIPTLLSEYEMKSEQDKVEYFEILSFLPVYFQSLMEYEKQRKEHGYFMASEDVDQVIAQCEFFCSENGRNLFRECFLSCLLSDETLTEEQKEEAKTRQEEAFCQSIKPAYEIVKSGFQSLRIPKKARVGLCQYKEGKDYYEARLRKVIGTTKSISELEKKLISRWNQLMGELERITADQGKKENLIEEKKQNQKEKQKEKEQTQYITELQLLFQDRMPESKEAKVSIKEIPSSLQNYTAPAYYFVPRISLGNGKKTNQISNVIYMNPSAKEEELQCMTTLAHEGYPGHMFQHMYFLNAAGVCQENVLRYVLDFPGYIEGWAMYVELMAYEELAREQPELDADKSRILRELQLCLLSYLDIQIHAKGAEFETVSTALSRIGIKDETTLYEVYSYLINEPGTYLKYYAGYLELLECKEMYQKKQKELGKAYQEKSFHAFFLSHGPDQYDQIKKDILLQSCSQDSLDPREEFLTFLQPLLLGQ